MKILHLTLKKKWFDMIASGEKKEEYRELKPYWIRRLVDINFPEEEAGENKTIPSNIEYDIHENGYDVNTVMKAYHSECKDFDIIRFKNGYSKDAPTIDVKCEGIQIGQGMMIWGAEQDKEYFVIQLGEILFNN